MIHLHGYSHYSLLQAIGNPKDIIQKAESLQHKAIAITDLNAGYGLLEFYEKAKDIKPILGTELNFSYDGKNMMNIVLLSKTFEGYKNIIKLISIANTVNISTIPYINMEDLKKNNEGIIGISSGNGEIEKLIIGDENDDIILDKIQEYENLFSGHFYLEFLTYDYSIFNERKKIENKFIQFIQNNNKKAIISSKYRYLNKEDKQTYDVLNSIKNNDKFFDSKRQKIIGEYYIMDENTVREIMTQNNLSDDLQDQLIQTTHNIEEIIDCKVPLHQLLFPNYDSPEKYKILYDKFLQI